jgi:hypothetical protein
MIILMILEKLLRNHFDFDSFIWIRYFQEGSPDSESIRELSPTPSVTREVPTWAVVGVQAKVLVVGLKVALVGRLVAE